MKKTPKYCFKCGVIRHGARGCVRVGGQRANRRNVEPKFGPWQRVPSPNRRWGMGGGWTHGRRWGRTQPKKIYDGDRYHQQWRSREKVGGEGKAGHDGGSIGTFTVSAKGGSNNNSCNSSVSLSIRDSGNKGALMEIDEGGYGRKRS